MAVIPVRAVTFHTSRTPMPTCANTPDASFDASCDRGRKTDDLVTRVARANGGAPARADEGYMSYTRFVALMVGGAISLQRIATTAATPAISGAFGARGHPSIIRLRNPAIHSREPTITYSSYSLSPLAGDDASRLLSRDLGPLSEAGAPFGLSGTSAQAAMTWGVVVGHDGNR
jgi:hypothetical protein